MDRYRQLALLVSRIYGATFIALALGWGTVALALLALGPTWRRSAYAYFLTSAAHFVAGGLIIAVSGRLAAFAIRP